MKAYSSAQAAHIWIEAGFSVIPIRADGSKAPALNSWEEFQTRIMSHEEVDAYFNRNVGIAIVCGAVSGGLTVFDIESIAPQAELAALLSEQLPAGFLPTLPQVITPSSGRHIYARCPTVERNQKLAQRVKPPGAPADYKTTMIETRGEGGYVVAPMSPLACHPDGKPYQPAAAKISTCPVITPEQREIILACCRSFNLRVPDEPVVARLGRSGGGLPGDDYNARGDALGVLLRHGWALEGKQNGCAYLRRPGKERGISASFGKVAPGKLYVFSSNAAPFDMEHAYDGFGIFARLECGGDFEAATRQLREQGYGQSLPLPKPPNHWIPEADPVAAPAIVDEPSPPSPEPEPAYSMKVTQDNVGLVFEERFKDELRYCDAWGQWLRWDMSRWTPERTLLAYDYSRKLARKLNTMSQGVAPTTSGFARGVEFMCRTSRIFATHASDWDPVPFQLNTPDGTLDLQSGEMAPHSPTDYITKVTRVSPAPGPCPVFELFLQEITLGDGGLQEYLQRALGACLSGAIQDNFLLFLYGTGQNGKNTFGDLITWILGDYAKMIPIDTLIANKNGSHPTTLANLRGLRLAVCSEVSEGSYWDESRVKSLTGDTEISARFMRQDFFEFPRTHKHLVYGNHRPLLRIVDPGMKARLHIIPFKAYFPPDARDPLMRRKLEAEAPAILQWLIDGHSRWLEDGYLKKCSAVQAETDSYFDAQSTNESWLAECCLDGHAYTANAKALYASFKSYKEARGEGVISQTRWGEWMGQRYTRTKTANGFVYQGLELRAVSVLDF